MNLSPHFTLEEMTRSEAAQRLSPPDENAPTAEHMENLKATCAGLEAVRTACGDRVFLVSSGYRNPRVNASVGGVKNSDHALGFACDFQVMGMKILDAARLIMASGIKFDQLIHETSRGILHISFNPRMRGQCLTQADGPGTAFTTGIS